MDRPSHRPARHSQRHGSGERPWHVRLLITKGPVMPPSRGIERPRHRQDKRRNDSGDQTPTSPRPPRGRRPSEDLAGVYSRERRGHEQRGSRERHQPQAPPSIDTDRDIKHEGAGQRPDSEQGGPRHRQTPDAGRRDTPQQRKQPPRISPPRHAPHQGAHRTPPKRKHQRTQW